MNREAYKCEVVDIYCSMACLVNILLIDGVLNWGCEKVYKDDTSTLITMLQLKNASQIIYRGCCCHGLAVSSTTIFECEKVIK